jgi:hypothetical protein
LLAGICVLLAGCPLRFENDPELNAEPATFFESAPADTTYRNEVQLRWIGTDLDSDVVAFQYQLVRTDSLYFATDSREGSVLRSIVPAAEPCRVDGVPCSEADRVLELWTERTTDSFESFSDLDDGWYEFRARAIDDKGAVDATPARRRFYVFYDDVPPVPEVRPCGRLPSGVSSHEFLITASDSSRHGATPRDRLQYSYRLRAESQTACAEHVADPFVSLSDGLDGVDDGWGFFPSGTDPVKIVYADLDSRGCRWIFTLRVRDPAGNVGTNDLCGIQTPE